MLTLECLLSDRNSTAFHAFSAYLGQQYCTENLMFWLAVEQYRQSSKNDRMRQCKMIVYTYIQPNSCREINIPCDMRDAIIDKAETYHPDLFLPASEAVLELMRANAFIPWLTLYDPSMLPTPPTPTSHSSSTCSLPRSSAMVSSLSSPDGWKLSSPTCSPRPSVSSFRSTNDIESSSSKPQRKVVGGLTYQSILKRMKRSFFHTNKPAPIRRSSLTWPSTSNRKK